MYRESCDPLVVASVSGLGTMSFLGRTPTGTAVTEAVVRAVRTGSGAVRALFVSFAILSSTSPGSTSFITTGAFRALCV